MRVKDCMCNEVIKAKSDTTLREIAKLMENNGVGVVPVCDEQDKVIGLITDRDIVTRCISANGDCSKTKASEVMTKQVIKTSPDTDIKEVCKTMSKNQIRRLPVVEQDKIIGMVTIGDISQCNDILKGNVEDTLGCICSKSET